MYFTMDEVFCHICYSLMAVVYQTILLPMIGILYKTMEIG